MRWIFVFTILFKLNSAFYLNPLNSTEINQKNENLSKDNLKSSGSIRNDDLKLAGGFNTEDEDLKKMFEEYDREFIYPTANSDIQSHLGNATDINVDTESRILPENDLKKENTTAADIENPENRMIFVINTKVETKVMHAGSDFKNNTNSHHRDISDPNSLSQIAPDSKTSLIEDKIEIHKLPSENEAKEINVSLLEDEIRSKIEVEKMEDAESTVIKALEDIPDPEVREELTQDLLAVEEPRQPSENYAESRDEGQNLMVEESRFVAKDEETDEQVDEKSEGKTAGMELRPSIEGIIASAMDILSSLTTPQPEKILTTLRPKNTEIGKPHVKILSAEDFSREKSDAVEIKEENPQTILGGKSEGDFMEKTLAIAEKRTSKEENLNQGHAAKNISEIGFSILSEFTTTTLLPELQKVDENQGIELQPKEIVREILREELKAEKRENLGLEDVDEGISQTNLESEILGKSDNDGFVVERVEPEVGAKVESRSEPEIEAKDESRSELKKDIEAKKVLPERHVEGREEIYEKTDIKASGDDTEEKKLTATEDQLGISGATEAQNKITGTEEIEARKEVVTEENLEEIDKKSEEIIPEGRIADNKEIEPKPSSEGTEVQITNETEEKGEAEAREAIELSLKIIPEEDNLANEKIEAREETEGRQNSEVKIETRKDIEIGSSKPDRIEDTLDAKISNQGITKNQLKKKDFKASKNYVKEVELVMVEKPWIIRDSVRPKDISTDRFEERTEIPGRSQQELPESRIETEENTENLQDVKNFGESAKLEGESRTFEVKNEIRVPENEEGNQIIDETTNNVAKVEGKGLSTDILPVLETFEKKSGKQTLNSVPNQAKTVSEDRETKSLKSLGESSVFYQKLSKEHGNNEEVKASQGFKKIGAKKFETTEDLIATYINPKEEELSSVKEVTNLGNPQKAITIPDFIAGTLSNAKESKTFETVGDLRVEPNAISEGTNEETFEDYIAAGSEIIESHITQMEKAFYPEIKSSPETEEETQQKIEGGDIKEIEPKNLESLVESKKVESLNLEPKTEILDNQAESKNVESSIFETTTDKTKLTLEERAAVPKTEDEKMIFEDHQAAVDRQSLENVEKNIMQIFQPVEAINKKNADSLPGSASLSENSKGLTEHSNGGTDFKVSAPAETPKETVTSLKTPVDLLETILQASAQNKSEDHAEGKTPGVILHLQKVKNKKSGQKKIKVQTHHKDDKHNYDSSEEIYAVVSVEHSHDHHDHNEDHSDEDSSEESFEEDFHNIINPRHANDPDVANIFHGRSFPSSNENDPSNLQSLDPSREIPFTEVTYGDVDSNGEVVLEGIAEITDEPVMEETTPEPESPETTKTEDSEAESRTLEIDLLEDPETSADLIDAIVEAAELTTQLSRQIHSFRASDEENRELPSTPSQIVASQDTREVAAVSSELNTLGILMTTIGCLFVILGIIFAAIMQSRKHRRSAEFHTVQQNDVEMTEKL